ncbi:MAG TPA: pitrilysin family protein, partial [Bryobacteraceae bacterium]
MKSLVLALVMTGVLGAQTQVRRATVLPSYKDLKFPPLPALKVPEPTEITLSNGMKVFLLEDHELPLINGTALVRTGNLFDPPDKKGLAGLTGDVMRSGGTHAKTGDQLDQELENVAASVESSIGESAGTLSFNCLKENADQVLGIFKDLLSAPEFRQDKVELSKTQIRSEISRRNDDAHGIAEREFSSILYGRNTPYGWEVEYSDIDHIQRQDLIDFYKRYYFPANVELGIYGDFSIPEMKAKLERIFGDWKVTQPPVPAFPKVEEKAAPGIFLADKDDVTQTFFDIGTLGGELRDKDYPALEVAAEILGGGFSSRLFRNVRTEHGWAYNIGASWSARYDHPGAFHISGSTQSAHTVDTLKAVQEEVEKIRTSEVSDEELQTAKDTVLNGFVFFFDRPSKTLNRLMQYEYYSYPRDFIFQYQKAVAAVTKADVLRVAKERFRPEAFTYVAVGNPKQFGTPLSALNMKVEAIDLTIPEPKPASAKTDAASLEKGKELLAKVQQSLGGPAKLAGVKDLQYDADVELQSPGGPAMKAKQTNSYLFPATMRQEINLPFGKQSIYSDGNSGWLAGMQGV